MFTKINEIIIPKTYITEDGEDNEPPLKILTIAKYWGNVVGKEISACIKDKALRKSLEALMLKDKLLKKNG